MAVLSQIIANSLIAGSIYALVACGFSLIFTTTRFMHFAHGIAVASGAYILFDLFENAGLDFALACVLTILFCGFLGVLINLVIYTPLKKRNASSVILLIASLAILIFFENDLQLRYGAGVKSLSFITVSKGMEFAGAVITPLQVVILITVMILLGLLSLLMKKSRLGRNMRAVADNPELASIVGINKEKIINYSFFIGSCLAGVAGILIGLEQSIEPTMGTHLMIKGFTGAVIGGITSVPGAVLGSYLLGFAENIGVWFLPSGYKDAIAFILLFIILLVKPKGLFGIDQGVKDV